MSKWEARNKGLILSRRKGGDNRLEFRDKPPIVNQEEKEAREMLKRKGSETKKQVKKSKMLETVESQEDTELLNEEIDSFSDSEL